MTTFPTPLGQVEALYVGYFGRAGDPSGANYWITQLNSGAITLASMAAAFAVQPEATTKYPYLATPNIADPGDFVDQVYRNLFNHAADPAGKAYWVAQLQASSGNPQAIGQFILNVISGATGTDDAAIRNKVDVAQDFTTKATNLGAAWTVTTQAQSSAEIAAVNDQAESVTAAKTATDVYFSTVAPGPPLNFTLFKDSLGTTGDRANFNAPLIFNAGTGTLVQSLQTGDSAFDTGANGTLFATLNSGSTMADVTLRGIPTATVTSLANGSGFSGNITGITTLNNNGSTGSLTLGMAGRGLNTALSTVNISGSSVGAGANTQALIAAQALAGTSDAVAVNVTGALGTSTAGVGAAQIILMNDGAAGTAGAPMNAYETETISSANSAFLQLSNAGTGVLSTSTLILKGAGAMQLSAGADGDFANLSKIDAAGSTGGVTITGFTDVDSTGNPFNAGAAGLLTANTVLTSFTGGTGSDRLDISNMTAAQVGAFMMLAGGDGRDALILDAAVLTTESALPISGFEVVGTTSGLAGTIDVTKLGASVDTIQLLGLQGDLVTIDNAPATFTVDLGAFSCGCDLQVNGPGGSTDVLNISGQDAIGLLTSTGFETVNLTAVAEALVFGINATASTGSVTTLNIIDNATSCGCGFDIEIATIDVGQGVVNVSGTGTGGVAIFEITATSLNASALNIGAAPDVRGLGMALGATGPISILGSNGSDFLTGSAGADVISGGPGDDIILNSNTPAVTAGDRLTGGSGGDIFFLIGNATSAALPTPYDNAPTITDFSLLPSTAADLIMLSPDGDDYGVSDLQADFSLPGGMPFQVIGSTGSTAILDATNELVKLNQITETTGLTLQQAFDAAIGSATITGATANGSYFFMMYDATNGKLAIGIVDASNGTDTVIEAGDAVLLVGSASMSSADYTNLNAEQFAFDIPS